jgi:hypothetical protein
MPTILIVFWTVLIGYPVVRLLGAILAHQLVKRTVRLGEELARDHTSPEDKRQSTASFYPRSRPIGCHF